MKHHESALFLRFRKNFESLLYENNAEHKLSRLDLSGYNKSTRSLLTCGKNTVINMLTLQQDLHRDDYLELAEHCFAYRGKENIHFKRPGAFHKERWMSKLLYAIKISLLEGRITELPHATITTRVQLTKLKRFVLFAPLIYSVWWFTSVSALQSSAYIESAKMSAYLAKA